MNHTDVKQPSSILSVCQHRNNKGSQFSHLAVILRVWSSEEETTLQGRWEGGNLPNPGNSSPWVQAIKAEDEIRSARQHRTDLFIPEGSGHNQRIKVRESKSLISSRSTPEQVM